MSGGGGGGGSPASGPSEEERALYQTQADISREQWDQYQTLGRPIQERIA